MKLPLAEKNAASIVHHQVSTKLDKIPDYFRDTVDWLIGRSRKKNPDKENLVAPTPGGGGSANKKNKPSNAGGSNVSCASQTSSYRRNHSVDLTAVCDTIDTLDLERLVSLPKGMDLYEWTAVHLLEFFHHVNVLYGSVSELCTIDSCPQMMTAHNTPLLWIDEKGKKCKYSAPQYIDCVMSLVEKVLESEDSFPTKFGHNFPTNFDATSKKLFRLLYNVLSHLHSYHWKNFCSLNVQSQARATCYHFLTFVKYYKILDVKEINALSELLKELRSTSNASPSAATAATSTEATVCLTVPNSVNNNNEAESEYENHESLLVDLRQPLTQQTPAVLPKCSNGNII